ncbi:unnamed protein product [Caenorhabditis auriculariae]|uniref:DUF676 domain-containing protein n=1 Tax=Caenorhabditis auriculariae TaxID=2777116 RepID=A0A8S1H6P1_9PELO|nr:unnamed protein product [Caenorhabditis auriculariae]
MRVDLHQLFNVNITLCEFFNVDLDERGYYQIRLVPKQTPDFLALDIVSTSGQPASTLNESNNSAQSKASSSSELLPASVLHPNIGISRTVEVTYVDEKFIIDDAFTISAQVNATVDLSVPVELNVDFELWFMDRYRPPRMDLFELQSRRTIQITLDPTRICSAARPIYFDCTDVAAITVAIHSAMISILPRRRKPPPDSALSPKLRNYHSSACRALLSATESIQQFISRHSRLLSTPICFENVEVEAEMGSLRERLECSERPWATLEAECVSLSSRLTTVFSQMLQLFAKCEPLKDFLFVEYDKWRRGLLGEAFFYLERTKDEVLLPRHLNTHDLLSLVTKGKYLSRLPRFPLFCAATDCPAESCPVVFEERFAKPLNVSSVLERLTLDGSNCTNNSAQSSASRTCNQRMASPTLGDRIRGEATRSLRLIKSRRKSADCSQSMAVRRKQVRPRTTTIAACEGLLRRTEGGDGQSTFTVGSESARSAREKPNDSSGENVPDDLLTRSNSASALPTSPADEDVVSVPSPSASVTSPLLLNEAHPKDLQTAVEFVREREAMKQRLRLQGGYEGCLYSESAVTLVMPLRCCPLTTSSLSKAPPKTATHLIVFVHGLEGSHEDLSPYRWALRQAAFAYEFCEEKEKHARKEPVEKFELAYLMSRANQSETWADITSMAHNLLNEVCEFCEEHGNRVKRISFVAHSLGGVIVRSAVGLATAAGMPWLLPILHTLMTINTPHLGLAYVGRHVHWGVQLVQWWKRSRSMEQLALRDALNFNESFLFSLSANQSFGNFRHILLIGTPNDLFVPAHSALIEPSKSSSRDPSALGSAYREMMNNVLSNINSSAKTETFIRYTTFHKVATAHSNRLTGRAAHIAAVEDAIFIEKLLSISALKYFI